MKKFYKLLLIFLSAIVLFVAPIEDVLAQSRTVRGTVTSADDGSTLPGVNIVVEGTAIGTSTGSDGTYIIETPSDSAALVFSFVGFQKQIVKVNGRQEIDVTL